MSTQETYTAEFRAGFRATLTVSLQGMQCQWTPDLPRNLPTAERDALIESYRSWRDECLEEFANANGLTVRVIHRGGIDCLAFKHKESQQ